jgi:hypothetical protein
MGADVARPVGVRGGLAPEIRFASLIAVSLSSLGSVGGDLVGVASLISVVLEHAQRFCGRAGGRRTELSANERVVC